MAIPFLSPIGNINISDGTPQLKLTDSSSSATTTLTLDGVNFTLQNNGTDGDFTIIGKDGSSYINLLAFDTSEGGNATFVGPWIYGNRGEFIPNTGAYDQLKIASNSTANTNKGAGIYTENYVGNNTSIFQYAANSSASNVYYGSADGNYRGITAHRFYINASPTATSGHTEAFKIESDLDATFTGTITAAHTLNLTSDGTQGWTNSRVILNATESNNRGAGIFMHNTAADKEFYAGVPYSSGFDKWGVMYRATTSHGDNTAAPAQLIFDVTSAGTGTFKGDLIIPATKALYLDGGGGTYIYESSDGVIDFYGDTTHLVSMKQNGTQSEVVVNESSGDVDFRVESNNSSHAFFVEAEGKGKVGIGDDNPDRKLSIIGDDSSEGQYPLSLDATNTDYTMEFRRNGTSEWWIKQSSGGFIIHENGVGDQLTVAAGGNTTIDGSVTADSLIKSGGTSSQYLMADGSVSTTSFSGGTVANATTFSSNVTFESEETILKGSSPELYFHTTGNHVNWMIAAQECCNSTLEFGAVAASTSLSTDASTYTPILKLGQGGDSTFAGTITISKSTNAGIGGQLKLINPHNSDNNVNEIYFEHRGSGTAVSKIESIAVGGGNNTNLKIKTESASTIATRIFIDSIGDIGFGSESPSSYNSRARDLVIKKTGQDVGISIVAEASGGTDYSSSVLFADGTGGTAGYRGIIEYDHADDSMAFSTAAAEVLSLNSDQTATFANSILMGNTVTNVASGFADQTGIGLKFSQTAPEIQVSSDSTSLQLGRTSTGGQGQIMNMRYASNTIHDFGTNYAKILQKGTGSVEQIWLGKVAGSGSGSTTDEPIHKTVLGGYSVDWSGGTRLANEGFLMWHSGGGWTGHQRHWALTNAYDISSSIGPKFALLLGDNNTTEPTLGSNGGLGTNTSVATYWKNTKEMVHTGAATFESTIGSGAITSTGLVSGTAFTITASAGKLAFANDAANYYAYQKDTTDGIFFNGYYGVTLGFRGSGYLRVGEGPYVNSGSYGVTCSGPHFHAKGVPSYRWTGINANGATDRRHTIMRVYFCPNHWSGDSQDIKITLQNEYYSTGHQVYRLQSWYGMGNGSSWKLWLDEINSGANLSGISGLMVSLGTVTDAGWDHSSQNVYYQDVYVHCDGYLQSSVVAEMNGHSYQMTNPTSGGHATVCYASPATSDTAYTSDAKKTYKYFGQEIIATNGQAALTLKSHSSAETIIMQLQASNGNNASTIRTTDSGYNTKLKAQNGGGLTLENDDASSKIEITDSSGIIVTGNISHQGLTATAGTDIDQIYTTTKSLTVTTSWQDTGIDATDLATGTYIIQMYTDDHGTNSIGHYTEYYSGIMSWYSTNTNSTDTDEIILHRAGHAPNHGDIFLRTERTLSADANDMHLQIKTSNNASGAANYVFKFRRMI